MHFRPIFSLGKVLPGEPAIFEQATHFISRLAYAEKITICEKAPEELGGLVNIVTHKANVYIPLNELVDFKAELERIAKEKEKAENGLRITMAKLSNEKFVANAPEAVVNAEREKAEKYRQMIAKLEESAKAMQG